MKTYTHLQPEELSVICALRKLRLSCSAIAEQLKRAPSTISRECRRVAGPGEPGEPDALYTVRAAKADRAKKRRRCVGNARHFAHTDPVFASIKVRLMDQHSPAQALGRLRREAEANGSARRMPSRATLYRLIEPLGWNNRERYPSMRLRRYYTQSELSARAERAPNNWVAHCPTVEQRPAYLTQRTLALCMEIDSIVGRKTAHA